MAEFILGRIKFVYQGSWVATQSYVVDDVVSNGGKTYICIKNHTSSSLFATDFSTNSALSKWSLAADGISWKNTWTSSTYYEVGSLVKYGGLVYQCNQAHTSATYISPTYLGLENDQSKWDIFATSFNWTGPWTINTRYKVNDFVTYGGITYVCNTHHISDATQLEDDSGNWDTFNAGITYLGTWSASSVTYKLNDIVKYGADLWICTTPHTSSATFSTVNFTIFVKGFEFENSWNNSTTYQIGDTVTYGGYSYIAKLNHVGQQPSNSPTYWDVYVTGFNFRGDWINSNSYRPGDVVRQGGYTYLTTTDSPSLTLIVTDTTISTDPTNPNAITVADTTGVTAGMMVTFASDVGGLIAGTKYYVLSTGLTATTFRVSTSVGGISAVLTTTTGRTIDATFAIQPPNISYFNQLNSGLRWTSSSGVYSAVSATNLVSLGTSATFNVTASKSIYSVTIASGGTGYANGDTLKILGTQVGGLSPVNDLTLTVTNVSGGVIQTGGVSVSGISVTWINGTVYVLGDVVLFGANSYICVAGHTAASANRPDNDTIAAYWNLITAGAEVATLTTAGDTFYYGPNGPTRLPVGTNGQILRSTNGFPAWSTYGIINNVVYVGPLGIDAPAPGYGLTIDTPWKTVRYACEQIEAGYQNPIAKSLLERNKNFFVQEVNNYLSYKYTVSITGTSSDSFTTADTSGLSANMPITFTSTVGGVTVGTTYYVKSIVSNTSFTISASQTNGVAGTQLNVTGSGSNTGNFAYDVAKTKRDTSYIIEAVIYDISRGGTQKITNATRAFFNSAGTDYVTTGTKLEITQFIDAQNYISTLVGNILSNTAPTNNYQSLNSISVGNRAIQIIDTSTPVESSALAQAQALITISTNALTAGSATAIPAVINPNTTISVKTGTFNEVLPIVVPANTAIVGDELRSTVIQPAPANPILATDKSKTISSLNRIKALIPDLLSNTTITPTTGNGQTQLKTVLGSNTGSVGSSTAVANLIASANTVYDIVASQTLSAVPTFIFPTPTNYNTSLTHTAYGTISNSSANSAGSTSGYGDGKAQIVQNYAFIKAEIAQFLSNSYNSLWVALGTTGQAKNGRDVGFILDAIQYDITYGGNTQSLIAGNSYYSLNILQLTAAEKTAFVDALGYLKTIIAKIATKTTYTKAVGNPESVVSTGTAGSAGSGGFAQDRVQDVIDWINNGTANATIVPCSTWVATAVSTSYTTLVAKRAEIASDATVWVQKFFQNVNLSLSLTTRDAGLIVDAIAYDTLFGTNFNAITAGRAYLRGTTSATTLINGPEKAPTLGAINFIRNKAKLIVGAGATTQIQTIIDDITSYIDGGTVADYRIRYPFPSNIDDSYAAGAVLLESNRDFILAEVVAYINSQQSGILTNYEYSSALTQRDAGYILDAVRYDLIYGGNYASSQAGMAYISAQIGNQVASSLKTAFLGAINYISTLVQAVVQDNAVSSPYQVTVAQVRKNGAQSAGSAGVATAATNLISIVYNYVNAGSLTTGAPTITITAIATTDTFTSNSHGLNNGDIIIPTTTANGLTSTVVGSGTVYYVVNKATNTFQLAANYNGTALATFTNGTGLTIAVQKINMPSLSWADAGLVTQFTAITANLPTYTSNVVTYITTNYPALNYSTDYAARDAYRVGLSVALDMVFNSNFNSILSGQAYYRPQAINVVGYQRTATNESLKYLQGLLTTLVAANSTAQDRVNTSMTSVLNIFANGIGEQPEIHGTLTYDNTVGIIAGAEILRANKTFLSYEATAWITQSFGGTVTNTTNSTNIITSSSAHNLTVGDPVVFTETTVVTTATATVDSTNVMTVGTTSGMVIGMPVTFTGSLFGNVLSGTTYYIRTIPSGTTITISATSGGGAFDLGDASGSMTITVGGTFGNLIANRTYYVLTVNSGTTFTLTATQNSTTPLTLTTASGVITVRYSYNAELCRRDMSKYIDAIVNDLQYTGNYKSLRAARLYLNAVVGSATENMFLVRDGSGLRNMTLNGLTGVLTVSNTYGTKRPTAGAYSSLDPGFGPNDSNSWIIRRSCYTQNLTMFGTSCSGMKIDGALHAGGNRSIVANDYTTIISDGIGVWCTGSSALTELVSVFNYYGYAGYLAELGGRIRATNGNSSYGTYGVIAEGTDTYETSINANLDNRAFSAQITNVITDGVNKVLRFEYGNAGSEYSNVSYTISGSGFNAAALYADEFRDSALFETRLVDLNDSNGFGGSNYVTATNAAQGGDTVSITIAATDQALTSAYINMRIHITAGSGVGQYANILNYTGAKVAQVVRDSFTNLTVTGTDAGANTLTVASTSTLYATMPIYLGTAIGGLSANTLYYVRGIASGTTFTVSLTSGGAVEDVTGTTSGQTVTLYAAGWDHVVPGTAIASSLDLTTTYVIEPRINYSAPGYTATARTLSASTKWPQVTFGANRFVAISNASNATSYSTDGKTWAAGGNLPSSTTWQDVIFGGGQGASASAVVGGLGGFGAVLTAVIGTGQSAGQVVGVTVVNGGTNYTTPPTIVFTAVSGGSGATGTAVVKDGIIQSVTIDINGSGYGAVPTITVATDRITQIIMNKWGYGYTSAPTVTITGGGSSNQATGTAVLTTSGVSSITIGNTGGTGYTSTPTITIVDSNAKFVAIAAGATNTAYLLASSTASTAWIAGNVLPASTFAALVYGNGVYVAIGGTASAASSTDGISWISRTIPTLGAGTYSAVAYGNGAFVAISTGNNATAYSTNGNTWTAGGNLPQNTTWTSIAYGNGRFVAVASGGIVTAYSLDNGATWVQSPYAGLPSSQTWTRIAYGQGLFVAVASGTAVCATSQFGLQWTERAMPSSSTWTGLSFGSINANPIWVATSNASSTTVAASIRTGAQALGRMKVLSNSISEVRIAEPGSGYPKGNVTATTVTTNVITVDDTTNLVDSMPVEFVGCTSGGLALNTTYYVIGSTIVSNTSFKVSATAGSATAVTLSSATVTGTYRAGPVMTQFDPNKIKTAALRARIGDGVLGNPSFSNRGTANTTATAVATGDGYSDLYQPSSFVSVNNLYAIPTAGANVIFASIPNTWYKLVQTTNILGSAGNYTAQFQINPSLSVLNAPANGDAIVTKLKYSQVRLTGHDFLYIGTGGFAATNYPFVNPANAIQANQTVSSGGGRSFFTSTDQDGNFNVGNLFGVQQATGTATLNASAFNLSGLQSLQLGAVSVGTGSAVITQFSTDPYFTANSDAILPTQKAIKSYITAQIGGGQSSLNVNTLTAGVVYIANNTISTTTLGSINVTAKMNFIGGIDGAPVALAYFMQK